MRPDTAASPGPARHPLRLALGLALALVLCCAAASCVVPLALYRSGSGYGVTACAGMVTAGRTQVGVWWQVTFMSRLMPATLSPYAACATLPWSTLLPPIGEIAFPP